MTPYSNVFDSFKDLMIRDTTFFKTYPDNILETRMLRLLKHAISNIMLVKDKKDFQILFYEIMNDIDFTFTEDLTQVEVDIMAYFMWQCYINEELVVRLKELKNMGFSDDEIKFFSPANSLKEFNASYDSLRFANEDKVKEYKRRDRLSFKNKTHKFSFDS